MLELGVVGHGSSQVWPSSRASVASGAQSSGSGVWPPEVSVVVDSVGAVQVGSVDGVVEPSVEVDGDDEPSVEVDGDGLPEVASGEAVPEPEEVCDGGADEDEAPLPAVAPDELGEPLPEAPADPEDPAAVEPEPLCDGVPEDDPAAAEAVLEPALPLGVVAASDGLAADTPGVFPPFFLASATASRVAALIRACWRASAGLAAFNGVPVSGVPARTAEASATSPPFVETSKSPPRYFRSYAITSAT